MPRTKITSDTEVLTLAGQVISRVGPIRFKLTDIAEATGLSPATLLQRFGSKRALLLACLKQGVSAEKPESHTSDTSSSREQIVSYLTDQARGFGDGSTIADHLTLLREDIIDDELNKLTRKYFRRRRKRLEGLVEVGCRTGELRKLSPTEAALTLEAVFNGGVLHWAIYKNGTLNSWVKHQIGSLLDTWRRT